MSRRQFQTRRAAPAKPAPAVSFSGHRLDASSSGIAPVLHSFAHIAANAPLQRKAERSSEALPALPVKAHLDVPVAAGSGRALPLSVRDKMEGSFGHSFSNVRVHEGPEAEAVGAVAYTRGSDLHFQPGRYDPFSAGGQELLGHELTHVVQQRAGRVSLPQQQPMGAAPINADPALEAEADALGAKAAAGQAASVAGAAAGIQRRADDAPVQCKGFLSWLLGKSSKDSPDAAVEEELPPAASAMPAPKDPLLNQWQDGAPNIKTDQDLRWNYSKDKAAGGAINQVDLLTYNQKIGSSTQGYFKEDKQSGGAGEAAAGIGIQDGDMRLANRAVASSRLAAMDAGGSPLAEGIAKTEFATHDGREGSVSEMASGRPLITKEDEHVPENDPRMKNIRAYPSDFLGSKGWAHDPDNFYTEGLETGEDGRPLPEEPQYYSKPGRNGDEVYKKDGITRANYFDFSNPGIQKGMNELQWHDALTGQVDRHGGNIFIDDKTNKVTGIDNDAAFGANSSDVTQLPQGENVGEGVRGSHNRGLPSQIDKQTADKYLALTPDAVEAPLKGLLRPEEIAATQARLAQMQAHIQGLYQAGKVIGMEGAEQADWNAETYSAATASESGSYLGLAANYYDENNKAGLAEKAYSRLAHNMLASSKYPQEPKLQIPKGLEKAVADMPSLQDEKFNRHRYQAPNPSKDLMNSYNQNEKEGLYAPNEGLGNAGEDIDTGRPRALSGLYGVEIPAPALDDGSSAAAEEKGRRRALSGLYGVPIKAPDLEELAV